MRCSADLLQRCFLFVVLFDYRKFLYRCLVLKCVSVIGLGSFQACLGVLVVHACFTAKQFKHGVISNPLTELSMDSPFFPSQLRRRRAGTAPER